MISKSLSTSQKYASLHLVAGRLAEFCQAMFPLLVAHADDFGRLAGDVFTVKHAIVPTSPRKLPEVAAALGALHQVGLIYWYEVSDRKCVQIVGFDGHQSGLHKRTKSEFPEPSGNFPEIPSEEKGTEGKGTEENRTEGKDADASETVEAFVESWNAVVRAPLSQCKGISDIRRAHIRQRLSERPLLMWKQIFDMVMQSSFCRGQNDRKWVGSIDWLVKNSDNGIKVLEGKYDDRASLATTGTDGRGRTGAPPKGKYDGIEEQD